MSSYDLETDDHAPCKNEGLHTSSKVDHRVDTLARSLEPNESLEVVMNENGMRGTVPFADKEASWPAAVALAPKSKEATGVPGTKYVALPLSTTVRLVDVMICPRTARKLASER